MKKNNTADFTQFELFDESMNIFEIVAETIEKRIDNHIHEHDGLYTAEEIEFLKPVWRKQIIEEVGRILK